MDCGCGCETISSFLGSRHYIVDKDESLVFVYIIYIIIIVVIMIVT